MCAHECVYVFVYVCVCVCVCVCVHIVCVDSDDFSALHHVSVQVSCESLQVGCVLMSHTHCRSCSV